MAQIVTELGERDHEPFVDRLREWLNGAPMDIHILRLGEHAAMKYAIGHAKGDDYQTFLDSTNEWASNLRAQRYIRVVTLVISLQWSDAALGPPWERVIESPPPHHAAGAEIDSAFLAERWTRQLDSQQLRNHSWLRHAGPIALLDARVLGSGIRAKTKATLLGQVLKIEHQLDPVECEILDRIRGRIPLSELIRMLRDLDVDEPTAIMAARSLLRRQLVRIDEQNLQHP